MVLDKANREKATFACHMGLFQFRVMPIALVNTPGVFQQMLVVLAVLEQFSMAYLDDILVFTNNISKHFQHLQALFELLKNHGLKLKLLKRQFMKEETRYLGFVINKNRAKPDADKIEVIRSMLEPKAIRQIKGF